MESISVFMSLRHHLLWDSNVGPLILDPFPAINIKYVWTMLVIFLQSVM
jgi:hypothetical protein